MASLWRAFLWMTTGATNFGSSGYARHSKNFRPEDFPADLNGKSIIVTGANSGLGLSTTKQLAKMG
eukprot:CAMPEP_0184360240 /NCGR_PEP_ID=MMETSP1089-20130417/124061_1 /TAXON_ID=38269 ORGANISM="Gloeochaete wittrockiana, Strain SAG46.84" /NCGR_SAMPLE_ID=MMETSP1089 /ASSEMBLY_ACC=CAM_ASM_000445 /LENGTH=65 /DNA_ID=CAMNT_0026699357 /DNA_START=15 /DNA_END=209 /DNA_ORIENTATION=-